MKKIKYIFGLSLLFVVGTTEDASAWLIMKMSNMAEDVTTAVTKVEKKAQNILDKAGNLTVVQKIGKGFKETKAWMDKNVSNVKSFADSVQEDIDSYKKMYEDTKSVYDQSLGGYSAVLNDIKELEKSRQEIMLKIEEVKTSVETKVKAQKSSISGQISSCNENMSNLKKLMQDDPKNLKAYENEYKQLEEKQKELIAQIDDIDNVAQQEVDSLTSEYKNELSNLKSKISQLKADLSKLAGFSEDEQSDEDALLNTANIYFLQYDEELNPQRQDAIRYNRLTERRSSIISAYENALKQIPDLNTKNNETEDLGYNASTFETTAGAWGASAQLQIMNLKALSAYAHLLVSDLKRQTALEMSNLTFYKLQKEQKNIAEFNLDDYVYEKKGDK